MLVCILLFTAWPETVFGPSINELKGPGPPFKKFLTEGKSKRALSPKEAETVKQLEKALKDPGKFINNFGEGTKETGLRLTDEIGRRANEQKPFSNYNDSRPSYFENMYTGRNWLANAYSAYRIARKNRDWQLARECIEICRKSPDLKEKQIEIEDLSRRIDNLQAVDQMPSNSLILEVLPSGNFHLAMNNPELPSGKETFKNLAEIQELQQKLRNEKRILIGPEARKGLADYDFTQVFPDKVVWQDPNLGQAAVDIEGLHNEILSLKDFSVALLFPRDARQQERLGLNWTEADRIRAWEAGESFNKESGISDIITTTWNHVGLLGWLYNKMSSKPVKEELFNASQTKKGVLIFFSHGDQDSIALPDGNKLTAEEVSNLDLSKNKPVVLIFSCEAAKSKEKSGKSDTSFSMVEAFKKAGAKAAFGFREKVDAGESISDALRFTGAFKSSRQGVERETTFGEGIEKMILEIQRKKGPRTLLKVKIERELMKHHNFSV